MVSKRIARLEARLGVRLLNRTTRRLELTGPGEAYHQDVVEILAAIRAAEDRVAGRNHIASGPLRVSAPTSFGRLHIAPKLKPFLDAHPTITLELNLSDEFDNLIGGRIDLAIRIAAGIEPGLTAYRLADSRRILCASPAYAAAWGLPEQIVDLSVHRLLAAVGQMPWRLTGSGGHIVFGGKSDVRTNSSEVVRELTLAGVGISLRSLWDVSNDLTEGRLIRVLPAFEGSTDVGIFAVHPKVPTIAGSVGAFLAYLRVLWFPSAPWDD